MQWKTRNVDFCTLTQRFGRAARDPTIEGFAVLLVEPACYNDDEEEDIDVGTKRKRKNKKLVKKSKRPRNDRTDLAPQSQLPLESQVPRGEDEDEDEDEEEDEEEGEEVNGNAGDGRRDPGQTFTPPNVSDGNAENVVAPTYEDRWSEYYEWSEIQKENKKTASLHPASRDLIGVREPVDDCRRITQGIFFALSKSLGKPLIFLITII